MFVDVYSCVCVCVFGFPHEKYMNIHWLLLFFLTRASELDFTWIFRDGWWMRARYKLCLASLFSKTQFSLHILYSFSFWIYTHVHRVVKRLLTSVFGIFYIDIQNFTILSDGVYTHTDTICVCVFVCLYNICGKTLIRAGILRPKTKWTILSICYYAKVSGHPSYRWKVRIQFANSIVAETHALALSHSVCLFSCLLFFVESVSRYLDTELFLGEKIMWV